jgi:glycosyltransferase involved in cell wall biosynthesis
MDVSIIIPMYNSEKYIFNCLESIIDASVDISTEIIAVDDGSTDNTLNEVKRFMHKYHLPIYVIKQVNMNASVARNIGMNVAKGKYMFFLDADDVIYPNVLSELFHAIENDKTGLAIGNFNLVSEKGKTYSEASDNAKQNYLEKKPINLCFRNPNPPNKLFKTSVITKYHITWGNVRIGQDLNFFLKYLVCIKSVSVISKDIFGWRNVASGISHHASLHILDITNSFDNTRKFYLDLGLGDFYQENINWLELEHYHRQMEKQKYFLGFFKRLMIIRYFSFFIKNIDVNKNSIGFNKWRYFSVHLKMLFSLFYASKLYFMLSKSLKKS